MPRPDMAELEEIVAAAVADAAEKRRELLIEQRLDGRPNCLAQTIIGSLPTSPSSSVGMAVSVVMVMA